ncbi:MAG: hypothetical protein QME51_06630 [Planctomycetota bacterium]|nr:hypothetical protein [Planctomycetota bacterium]
MLTFLGIQNEIKRRLRRADTDDSNAIKLAVNMAYQEIWNLYPWKFAEKRGRFDTVARYKTGTVSVTNGSTTVIGSGTTFTSAMAGRKFVVDGDAVAYKIATFDGITQVTLETQYRGTTNTSTNYSIYQDEYKLAGDCATILRMWQTESPQKLYEEFSSDWAELLPAPHSLNNEPQYYKVTGLNDSDYYNTGTVTATSGSTTISGSGTTFTAAMVGMVFRVSGDDAEYLVSTFTSTTSIAINKNYGGSTASGSSYAINPVGTQPVIEIYPGAKELFQIQYHYKKRPMDLVNNADVPEIPPNWHWVLVLGGYYHITPERSDNSSQASIDWEKAKRMMRQWASPSEDKVDSFRPQYLTDRFHSGWSAADLIK